MLPKVMCVEDDLVAQMVVKIILKDEKFCGELVTAENGQVALRYFEEQLLLAPEKRKLPNLVLLDLNMPIMGGWEFLEAISSAKFQSLQPDIKVIILSSSIDPNDTNRASKNPLVCNFIPKPFTSEVVQKIKKDAFFQQYF
jgi:CheY-like chemotaxis protein